MNRIEIRTLGPSSVSGCPQPLSADFENCKNHERSALPFPVPVVFSLTTSGIGIGLPGEFSNLAVNTSTPVSVTSKVCSSDCRVSFQIRYSSLYRPYIPNCAVRLPSTVTFVQSSGQYTSRLTPKDKIGSIVNVIPGLQVPTALFFA